MLRTTPKVLARSVANGAIRRSVPRVARRCLLTSAAGGGGQGSQRVGAKGVGLLVCAVLVGGSAAYLGGREVHNDALFAREGAEGRDPTLAPGSLVSDEETLHSLVWGTNRTKLLSPTSKVGDTIRTPAVASWLDGVALRDLQFHEDHAACIDAKGDVYQWGAGYYGDLSKDLDGKPQLTLKGKNIVQLQLTEDKVYALSASGNIYSFSSKALNQIKPPGAPTPASDSWWGTGWLWGEEENIDFAQIKPAYDKLNWREKFTSIAAGKGHLLALTSKGRVFGHPVNKTANSHGQLGFQKFTIPDPVAKITGTDSHIHVDLVPKSLADPFLTASRSVRISSDATPTNNLANINDASPHFCPYIFEIPVLRGVQFEQIAAGTRTSFARTPSGRVLAWGANEYGQLGLGANVAVDTITVPTEVILWRAIPGNVNTKCTNVIAGGDLSAFVVDRSRENEPVTTDLLMSGNGQYGGLGSNVFTTSQANPSRVKSLSGLQQYNDKTKALDPIKPDKVTIGPTGHVLLSITSSADSHGVGGNDVLAWGRNFDSELGNGKKSSTASPANLQVPGVERLMLMERNAKQVKDLHGKVWGKGVKVQQTVASGYGTSAIYWKIVN